MDNKQFFEHRDVLFRYALLKLHDDSLADDAVQETLLAALQAGDNFRNQANIRTWLIGILKHKIADHYRIAERYLELEESNEEDPNAALEQLIFDGKGRWISAPSKWQHPDHSLEQEQFWTVFDWCQNNLPKPHAQAFILRELVGLENEEICQDMNISYSACRVYLHRARLKLRECLEQRWFNLEKHR